jgi:hypothetical protein
VVQEGVKTDFSNYRIGFGTAWELDFWGKFRRIVEAADASLAAQIAAYDAVLVTVTGEVASAYILLRTLEQQLVVARSNADIQRRTVEIADVRRRNELASELDVTQAQVQLKNTEASIPRLEAALREVENALSMLLGAARWLSDCRRTSCGAAPIFGRQSTWQPSSVPASVSQRRSSIRVSAWAAPSVLPLKTSVTSSTLIVSLEYSVLDLAGTSLTSVASRIGFGRTMRVFSSLWRFMNPLCSMRFGRWRTPRTRFCEPRRKSRYSQVHPKRPGAR